MLSAARDGLLSLLYPTLCHVCGALAESWDDGIACRRCWETSDWSVSTNLCLKCGVPVSSRSPSRCGMCEPLTFTAARSCGPYQGAWRESVLWLKTNPHIARRICKTLATAFTSITSISLIEMILPVPLHPTRERARGFNQAQVIAEELSRSTGTLLNRSCLVRVSATGRHRAGMDAAERARSLKGAFKVRAPRLVAGRRILLVDDVMTTAATADAVSATLLSAGAREVSLLTLARVISRPL